MTKIAKTILFVFIISSISFPFFSLGAVEKIIFFWGHGCPHCAKVEAFLQSNHLDRYFNVDSKEIYFNKKNREEFMKICDEENIPLAERGVPMAFIGGKCVIGDKPIIDALKAKIEELNIKKERNSVNSPNQKGNQAEVKSSHQRKLTFPLVISAAAVDSVNPCAFAVLIILMTTILAIGSRKRALFAGLAFALSIYISYLLMGLGIYRALSAVRFSNLFMKFIGSLAIIVGVLNVKDYFWYGGGGFLMEVPRKWRPKMKLIIHSVTSPIGAFVVGFLVSLFLLPCTSGPYIVILGMLSQKEMFLQALSWLLLYNLIFILPMIGITIACYFGLSPQKAEEVRQRKLRVLHLIAGLIMIGMGVVILLKLV
ncbi:cytochrome c biogenesis protein [bacterium]|nr:cytochrome c biogenesis protein [bacterium]